MPNYQEMYATLFRRVTAVISDLQEAQQQTEEMYVSSNPPDVVVLETSKAGTEKPETEA